MLTFFNTRKALDLKPEFLNFRKKIQFEPRGHGIFQSGKGGEA